MIDKLINTLLVIGIPTVYITLIYRVDQQAHDFINFLIEAIQLAVQTII